MEKSILKMLLILFGALAFFYVAFLGNMVWNIVERKAYENRARVLYTEVSELELSYLKESQEIDLELSKSLGFKEAKVEYATRKEVGSVTLVKNEI